MRTVEEINAQIGVHRDNIDRMKDQIDELTLHPSAVTEEPFEDVTTLEEEIAEEWGEIRDLETERDELQTLPLF